MPNGDGGALTHTVDMLIAHRLLKATETGELKAVSRGNLGDFVGAFDT